MTEYVVDENVPIVANDTTKDHPITPQANLACRISCVRSLREIVERGVALVDEAGEVMARYRSHLSGAGQPGVGDAFLKHLSDNQFNRRKIKRVSLRKDNGGNFDAFPKGLSLAKFDQDDRVFVALALSSNRQCTLLNAVDSDYSEHAASLKAAGLVVRELCPDCLR
jgi:hypothetical protein